MTRTYKFTGAALAAVGLMFSAVISGCKKEEPDPPAPATGSAFFYFNADCGQGPVTINCAGQVATVNQYFSSGNPDCGTAGGATFADLSAGNYPFRAVNAAGTWEGIVTVTAAGCSEVLLNCGGTFTGGGNGSGNGSGNGNGGSSGDALMWIATDFGYGPITVSCNGQQRSITSFYSSGVPACGASGCANFSMSPGTYNFTASCSGRSWNGTTTISAGGCSKTQLTLSGGGGTGGQAGQAMFWIQNNSNCGNITVNCNGMSQIISAYYSGGAPSCGANGCAMFNLQPGTYSFTASCSTKNWNGTVTVSAGGCYAMRLNQ